MEKNDISMDLRLRIKEYLRYSWQEENNQSYDEEEKILSYLPTHLKHEFLVASYGALLTENPIFYNNFSKKCLNETVFQGNLKQLRFAPGEPIFDVFA